MIDHTESPETYKARKKLKYLFESKSYTVEEEVALDTVTNNMEEEIWPRYQADMLLTQQFIIELDSKKLHGTHRKIVHDQWRDKNIKKQMNIKTVRLLSTDVNRQSPDEILQEVEHQLKFNNKEDED